MRCDGIKKIFGHGDVDCFGGRYAGSGNGANPCRQKEQDHLPAGPCCVTIGCHYAVNRQTARRTVEIYRVFFYRRANPAGSPLDLSATVKNEGAGRSGPYAVKFYLARNPEGNPPGNSLATAAVTGLGPNATKSFNRFVSIPGNLAAGTYWLVARVKQSGHHLILDTKTKQIAITLPATLHAAPAMSPIPSSSEGPRIRVVTQAPMATGRSVTITGDRFGPPGGTIQLGFNEPPVAVALPVTQ